MKSLLDLQAIRAKILLVKIYKKDIDHKMDFAHIPPSLQMSDEPYIYPKCLLWSRKAAILLFLIIQKSGIW